MTGTLSQSSIAAVFEQHSSKTLLVLADGRTISYGEFLARSENMARRLAELGAVRGSRIIIRLENSQELLALYLACALAGVAACPIDPAMPKGRVDLLRTRLTPALLVDDGVMAKLLADSAESTALPEFSLDADFLIIFSSGSTGEPKGIVHTIRSMTESAASFARLSGMNGDTVIYHHLPMFYMAGIFNMFFCPVMSGGSIVLGPAFSKAQMLRFWETPLRHGVNHLTLTPTMALSLCQLFRTDGRVLDHLSKYQAVVATGSPLYRSIAEKFLGVFNVPLRSCYGVTEIGGTITFQSWEDALAIESMGRAAPETQIRAGIAGAAAEILVKTPFMARGYLVKGEIVRFVDGDGFFHTGDHGYVQDGRLYFAGREHDLIKKGGEFVSAQLIEDIALRNPHVVDVAAVGVPDEFWGARVVLFYVPAAAANEAEALSAFELLFEEGLRKIERPDKIIPVPWMPKTAIGKIVKRELVQKYTVGDTPGA